MRFFVMFVTAVCVLFLIKLRRPKKIVFMIIISCRHKLFKYSYRTKKVVTVNQRCCYCFLFNAWLPVRLHDAILNVTNIVLFKRKQDCVTIL